MYIVVKIGNKEVHMIYATKFAKNWGIICGKS